MLIRITRSVLITVRAKRWSYASKSVCKRVAGAFSLNVASSTYLTGGCRGGDDAARLSPGDPLNEFISGGDQAFLTSVWNVVRRTGCDATISGTFAGGCNVGELYPVVSAVAKVICEVGRAYELYAHKALMDSNPAQRDSFISVN